MKKNKNKSFRILAKMSFAEFRFNWAQILAIIFISAIAVTMFSGFIANSASLKMRLDKMITESNAADIYVTVNPLVNPGDDDMEFLTSVVNGRGQIEGRFYTFCTVNGKSALGAISPFMPKISHAYEITSSVDEQTDGTFFLMDERVMKGSDTLIGGKKIALGDTVEVGLDLSAFTIDENMISLLDSFLLPGAENPFKTGKLIMNFKVTGSMKHIENVSKISFAPNLFLCSTKYFRNALRETLSASFNDVAVSLIWQMGFHDTIGWGDGDPYGSVYNFPSPDQYLIKLNEGVDPFVVSDEIQKAFAQKENDNLINAKVLTETPSVSMVNYDVLQASQLTWVFPIVFFLVALLIVLVSNRQTILRQRGEIGTLKALGFGKGRIFFHYISQTGVIVLIGAVIGIILGPILVPFIMDTKYKAAYTLPQREIYYPVLYCILTVLAFVGVSALMSFLVIRREIHRKPVESLRPLPPKSIKHAKQVSNVKKSSSLFGITLKLTLRNISKDLVKTFMVIIGVLGCTTLLCCGFGMEDTINYGVNTDPFINSGADVSMFFALDQSEETLVRDFDFKDENGEQMIYGFQPYYMVNMEVNSDTVTYNTTVNVIGNYHLLSGTAAKPHFDYEWPQNTALLSEKTARQLNVKVGDKIWLNLSGELITIEVGGTFPVFYDNGLFIHSDTTVFNTPFDEYNALWLDANPNCQEACQVKGNALSYVALCDTKDVWSGKLKTSVQSVFLLTNSIKIFAILLAAIVFYNLGLLNFRERMRETATLKVLGFRLKEIAVSLIIEFVILTIIGVGIGLALGMPFTKLVLAINEISIIDWMFYISPATYCISFALTFGTGLILNLLLMLRLKKIKGVEALKSVE